jgi:hypothetical protein
MLTFNTTLATDTINQTSRYIALPPDVATALAAKGKMRVRGTLNDVPFETSLAQHGTIFVFPVKQVVRQAAGLEVGSPVTVTIAVNHETHPPLPEDVAAAFAAHPNALAAWHRLIPSRQRHAIAEITGAKKAETRTRRLLALIETLTNDA